MLELLKVVIRTLAGNQNGRKNTRKALTQGTCRVALSVNHKAKLAASVNWNTKEAKKIVAISECSNY